MAISVCFRRLTAVTVTQGQRTNDGQGSAADIMKRAQNTVYEKCGMDTASHNGIAVEPWDGYATETKELLGCKPFMLHGHTDMVA